MKTPIKPILKSMGIGVPGIIIIKNTFKIANIETITQGTQLGIEIELKFSPEKSIISVLSLSICLIMQYISSHKNFNESFCTSFDLS